jgi:PAS domain S-box-containing protein
MHNAEFHLRIVGDARLAVHATSAFPAWLWSIDGTRVLWSNPAAAQVFAAANPASLSSKTFGPADRYRRQVAQLAARLPSNGALRLERLRGFGASLGMLMTCGCARLEFADGGAGVLIVATEPIGRAMPLIERLQRLVEGIEMPVAAFARDGIFVGASDTARPLLGSLDLSGAIFNQARNKALQDGRSEIELGFAHVVLQRLGSGAEIGLLASIEPDAASRKARESASPTDAADAPTQNVAPAGDLPVPAYERAAMSGEAPAEFALIDASTEAPQNATLVSSSASNPVSASMAPASHATGIGKILPAADLPSPSGAVVPASGAGSPAAEPGTSTQGDLDRPVETQDEERDEALKNVVPFRPAGEARPPVLTPVENSAFNELARQLSARLEGENATPATANPTEAAADGLAMPEFPQRKSEPPSWLSRAEPPARGESGRERMLLDLLPGGILIYRLDRLLYANAAFLDRIGYASLHALEQAGGLDALYVEPGVSSASSTSETGTPVTISVHNESAKANLAAIGATLHTISWDGETAHALILSAPQPDDALAASAAPPSLEPSEVGQANAEELGAILDTAADGIVMFDAQGNLNSCNRSAEALFGHDGAELVQRNLFDLFAPESQGAVKNYLASLKEGNGVASLLEHGCEVLARVRSGGLLPLSLTMGRTQSGGPNFFAVFRDLSQAKRSESELREARLLADRAGLAKADLVARISHEIRAPLNAIIGFAEVMIGERFGPLGNERYVEYMKDIRASGERVVAIIDNLADLSQIETGRLDLSFTSQNLNELVESCVCALQPQANRERIIIRTSLAHMLPPVVADAGALRQIALNLIGNSIHLARTGGQVIVSTALTDLGDVVLRVRDTGNGLNDDEVAAAMQPFRMQGPSDQTPESSPVSLSLTRALVEANRAQFHIRTGTRAGTLVEVVFSPAMEKT